MRPVRKHSPHHKRGARIKGRTFPPEVLRDDEVQLLMGACRREKPTGLRNRALLAVLYRSGLRIAEALSLMPKDVDTEAGIIRVLHGKGNKARTVGVDRGAIELVLEWLQARLGARTELESPLFCTMQGRRMWATYVRAMLRRLARRVGIQKRVHPHGLRHTHAAELAAENVPINVIQAQLGHTNAATTSRYLQHIAPQQLIATIQQRDWRAE